MAGEVERLEPNTEGPIVQVLQEGVQDDRLAGLDRQGGCRVFGDHFDAFIPTTEEETVPAMKDKHQLEDRFPDKLI